MTSLLIVVGLAVLGGIVAPPPSPAYSPVLQAVTEPTFHGEGCFWDSRAQVVYYVDIIHQLVKRYDPASSNVTTVHIDGGPVSLVLPVGDSADEFLVTRGRDVVLMQWDGRSSEPNRLQVITGVEADKPDNQFNDGKADASGRVWLGTMGPQPFPGNVIPHQGSFYSIDKNSNSVVKHLENVSVSNGLVWNKDNEIMYYIDSPTLNIDAFDFDITTGKISNRRTVFDFLTYNLIGIPDGMTIDAQGNLWIANFYGGKVLNVDPRSGELIQVIDFPVSLVSDVVFGDPDLSTLYVTTSQYGLTNEELAEQPLAGALFAVTDLGVRGVPSFPAVRNVPAP